jgi:cyanate lyase
MDHAYPKGHTRTRKLLSPEVAANLAEAHRLTGCSYRRVAAAIGIDWGYWRRLTLGERCPSREVAERIVAVLGLDPDTATQLREEAVERIIYPPR